MAYKDERVCALELASALHGVTLTDEDVRRIGWLAGWGQETTDWLIGLLERVRSAARA